jgi:hypothetical protein
LEAPVGVLAELAPTLAVEALMQAQLAPPALVAVAAVRHTSRSFTARQPLSSLLVVAVAAAVPVSPTEVRPRQLKGRLLRPPLVVPVRFLPVMVAAAVQVAVAIRRVEPAAVPEPPVMVAVAAVIPARTRMDQSLAFPWVTTDPLPTRMALLRSSTRPIHFCQLRLRQPDLQIRAMASPSLTRSHSLNPSQALQQLT